MDIFSQKSNSDLHNRLEPMVFSSLRKAIKRRACSIFATNAALFGVSAGLGIISGSRFYREASETGLFAYLSLFVENSNEAFSYMSDILPIITHNLQTSLFVVVLVSLASAILFSYKTIKTASLVFARR